MKRPVVLLAAVLAAAGVAIGCEGPRGPAGPVGPPGSPAPSPGLPPGAGLGLTIEDASIGADMVPAVDFQITDAAGNARTMDGVTANWTLASEVTDLDTGITSWEGMYTRTASGIVGTTEQPTSDSTGTYTDLGGGHWRYTFSKPIAGTDDPAATHRVGVYARHPNGTDEDDIVNDTFDFVPTGLPVATDRDVVTTEACNTCHNPLSAHGGPRREAKLCVTCHTPQLFDPDTEDPALPGEMNPLDLSVMVHRIHEGEELPSLVAAQAAGIVGAKYEVIGHNMSEAIFGETLPDGKDTDTLPDLTGVAFPQAIQNCVLCHQGTNANAWKTTVSRAECRSCHDTTWFGDPATVPARMHAHAGGPFTDDKNCVTCHPDATGNEFDLSVAGAHVNPIKSSQLHGLDAQIVSVTLVAATNGNGSSAVVVFRMTNHDDGSPLASLAGLSSISVVANGPTSDFNLPHFYSASVKALATYDAATGNWTATTPVRAATDPYFPNAGVIPAGSEGSYAFGIEARRSVALTGGPTVTEGAFNPVTYVSVDGSPVQPRRLVVAIDKCNACHDKLALHGGQRFNTEYCVLCHNPSNVDWSRRPKSADKNTNLAATNDGIEERSINFKDLIHRIHTGDNLDFSTPYDVYGFGGSLNAFDEVRFPGDRSKCGTCHAPGTYEIDAIPADALPTLANQTGTIMHSGTIVHAPGEPSIPPIQAACVGCHDTTIARAHAEAMTVGGSEETCIVCHGAGQAFDVKLVHGITE